MLGEFQIFTWKTKATQQKEQEDYAKWAFPYGEKQRENLTKLLLEIYPRETVPTTLIPFLTCRELFEGVLKNSGTREDAIDHMMNGVKKYKRIIKKADMPMYLAVVLANETLDDSAEYPSAETIKERAVELELLRRKDSSK